LLCRRYRGKTGLKPRAVNTHLLGLRRAGLVTMSGDDYVITKEGKENIGFQDR